MSEEVTIVVVPRDRFSSVTNCIRSIIENTDVPFRLLLLDLGYPRRTLSRLRRMCDGVPLEIVSLGLTIPMDALAKVAPTIQTRYLAWVDNDTFVTAGWLSALIARAEQGARVVSPLTLEREGLDVDPRRIPLRNHISHSELRKVRVGGKEYVFDYKPYRRAAPEEIPQEAHRIDFFELHAMFLETAVLAQLDLPSMVVREHVDLGIQLHRLGIDIWCEPQSVVVFDNIHTRPTIGDIRFFFYRWARKRIDNSHEQFEKRWGYRFYNEQFMSNWAFRRKVFSLCRFVGVPHRVADVTSRIFCKLFQPPIPHDRRSDPTPHSERVLECREVTHSASHGVV